MVSVEERLHELQDRFWNSYPKDDRSVSRNRKQPKTKVKGHSHKLKKK